MEPSRPERGHNSKHGTVNNQQDLELDDWQQDQAPQEHIRLLPQNPTSDTDDDEDEYSPRITKLSPKDGALTKLQKILLCHARPLGRENDALLIGDSPVSMLWKARRGKFETLVYAPVVLVYGIMYIIVGVLVAFLFGLGNTLSLFTAAAQVLNDSDLTGEMLGELSREEKMAALTNLDARSPQTIEVMIQHVLKPPPVGSAEIQRDITQIAIGVDQTLTQFGHMLNRANEKKAKLQSEFSNTILVALVQKQRASQHKDTNQKQVTDLGSPDVTELFEKVCDQNINMATQPNAVKTLLLRQLTINKHIATIERHLTCGEQSAAQLSRMRLAMLCGETVAATTTALYESIQRMGKDLGQLASATQTITPTIISGLENISTDLGEMEGQREALNEAIDAADGM